MVSPNVKTVPISTYPQQETSSLFHVVKNYNPRTTFRHVYNFHDHRPAV